MSNKAKFDIIGGVSKAFARNKNPHTDTLLKISYYNVLGEYVNNINKLANIANKTGQGIIHFNPQQLVKRLELLAGSIFAGNNGVKQEFSQIVHLLHQLKVITKMKYLLANRIFCFSLTISFELSCCVSGCVATSGHVPRGHGAKSNDAPSRGMRYYCTVNCCRVIPFFDSLWKECFLSLRGKLLVFLLSPVLSS